MTLTTPHLLPAARSFDVELRALLQTNEPAPADPASVTDAYFASRHVTASPATVEELVARDIEAYSLRRLMR